MSLSKSPTIQFTSLLCATLCWGGCSNAPEDGSNADSTALTRICGENLDCKEVQISGENLASVPGEPILWRGYGDPSLEHDPITGDIWMSYS